MELFQYHSFREYLKYRFEILKEKDSKYSLIFFSKQIGSSESYLKLVLSGKRNLNLDKAKLLSEKLGLNQTETSYFLTLVMKDSAKSEDLKKYYEGILDNFREFVELQYSDVKSLSSIFRDSVIWDIYSLAGISDFKADPVWITKILKNKNATLEKVTSSLNYLLETGALYEKDGKVFSKDIIFKHNESDLAYITGSRRAIDYIRSYEERDNDYFDSFSIILEDEDFEKLKNLLEETKKRIVQTIKNSSSQNPRKKRICYYNSNLFFGSRSPDDIDF